MSRQSRLATFLFLLCCVLYPWEAAAKLSLLEQGRLYKAQKQLVASASLHSKEGKYSEALDQYERALRMQSSAAILLSVAEIYELQGDKQSAAEVYEVFLSMAAADDPKRATAESKVAALDPERPLGRFALLLGTSRMVPIDAGEFMMGLASYDEVEKPEHKVRLSAYSIDAFEVSNSQYQRCVLSGACEESAYADDPLLGLPSMPVVGVRWADAEKYCRFVGKQLPSEAEWERAARGTDGRLFPWGNEPDCKRGNFGMVGESDFGCLGKNPGRIVASGSYPDGRSPVGAYDMAGNVQEWVADWFLPDYYKTSEPQDPRGPSTGEYRVVRGGSFGSLSSFIETTDRKVMLPESYGAAVGFRCVKRTAEVPASQP
jgi:formylglycine-generating enzyme required for sulfatase activity